MAEFNPINTQEEFDALIKPRLERERNTVKKEFADYEQIKNDLNTAQAEKGKLADEVATLKGQMSELSAKLSASETDSAKTRIALELGLPYEMRNRLKGTSEEEIKKDAEELVKFFNAQKVTPPPLYNPEAKPQDPKDAALREMLQGLKK